MIVLVLGSGMAAHLWAWRLAQSKKVQKVYTTAQHQPSFRGKAQTEQHQRYESIAFDDTQGLLAWARQNRLAFAVAVGMGADCEADANIPIDVNAGLSGAAGHVAHATLKFAPPDASIVLTQLQALHDAGFKTLGACRKPVTHFTEFTDSSRVFERNLSQNTPQSATLPPSDATVQTAFGFNHLALYDGTTVLPLTTTARLDVPSAGLTCSPAPTVTPTVFAQTLRDVLRPAVAQHVKSPAANSNGLPLRGFVTAQVAAYILTNSPAGTPPTSPSNSSIPQSAKTPKLDLLSLNFGLTDADALALLARLKGDALDLLLAAANGRLAHTEALWDRRFAVVAERCGQANGTQADTASEFSMEALGFTRARMQLTAAWGDTLKHAHQQVAQAAQALPDLNGFEA